MLCFSDSSLWLQTPRLQDHVSIRARLGVPLLLFMGCQLPDTKDGVHSPELWVHSVNRHPSTERRPGKVCTGPKNSPAVSSSASCHLKVTTGQFATWTTCYLCSFLGFLILDGQRPSTCCSPNKTQHDTAEQIFDVLFINNANHAFAQGCLSWWRLLFYIFPRGCKQDWCWGFNYKHTKIKTIKTLFPHDQ